MDITKKQMKNLPNPREHLKRRDAKKKRKDSDTYTEDFEDFDLPPRGRKPNNTGREPKHTDDRDKRKKERNLAEIIDAVTRWR